MTIHCLGINHHTADIKLRECLAFSLHQLHAALSRFGCGQEEAWKPIQEAVILSTCSRVEVYAVSQQPEFELLEAFLAETHAVSPDRVSPHAYRLQDDQAVAHLLRVAAGLDSIVLGEPQILGQVTEAYSIARQHGAAGKILSRLFQTAIRAGKRTRTETRISHNPGSISSMAVNLIAREIPDLPSARVLVIGAGEMAELAVEALRKRGVHHFTVVNRTVEKARLLAERWDGTAASLGSLEEQLQYADAVISSTGAPHTILGRGLVEAALAARGSRPLVLMDIAVPRDVDTAVDGLPNVYRYDMDALSGQLETSLARRAEEIPAVEAILAEEQLAFRSFLDALEVLPVITQLREQADSIREAELHKALRRMPELTPESRQQLEVMTRAIVKKILHQPTIRLREVSNSSNAADYTDVTRSLFGLD